MPPPDPNAPPIAEPEAEEGDAPSVRVRRYAVTPELDGERLDRFLSLRIRRLSRSQLRRVIRSGNVALEPPRVQVKPAARVRRGDLVVVTEHLAPEPRLDSAVGVLAVAPSFIALNKPAGMLVHPTATAYENTIVRYAERQGWDDAGVVHRLDRETSGVLVLGRGLAAQRRWSARFADGEVRKRYLAVVIDPRGQHVVGGGGLNEQPLGRDPDGPLPDLLVGPGDWQARTRWRCLARGGELALLDVRIEGGRQHQIRAHLAMHGTPIAGDKLYAHGPDYYLAWLAGEADEGALRAPRQALHAWQLGFMNDAGEREALRAPPPALFEALVGPSSGWLEADTPGHDLWETPPPTPPEPA